ncbi:S10 family peptidase [Chitinimonas naiadis]
MRYAPPLATYLAVLLAACGGGGGGDSGTTTPPPGNGDIALNDPVSYSGAPGASLPSAQERAAITHHTLSLNGLALAYTATTGHLTASHPQTNAAEASFFYVAYTLDGQAPGQRPVTFFYNGGPGSASVWLHLGAYGPKRLATGAPATNVPTPFQLVDNAESLLDVSDLVFVDAVGTGYTQAIAPNTNQQFWGVDADAAVFRDFVTRYLTVNQRTASPKYLFGESYGTLRSALLADLLESAGTRLSGVILQSSIMNYNSNCAVFNPGTVNCAGYLPSYGVIGAYFNLTQPAQGDPAAYATTLRSFSAGSYAPAVDQWIVNRVTPNGLVAQLVNATGAPAGLWQTNLSLDPTSFQYGLQPPTLIGRYDARVTAPLGSQLASEGDPSSTFISPSFASTIRSYLPTTLKYSNSSTYNLFVNAIDSWNWQHDAQALPDAIPDLAAALLQNPALRILSLNGYHDLATPFYQTELDLARLGPTARVQIRNYPGGHMTYLDDGSRRLGKADLASFYRAAAAP